MINLSSIKYYKNKIFKGNNIFIFPLSFNFFLVISKTIFYKGFTIFKHLLSIKLKSRVHRIVLSEFMLLKQSFWYLTIFENIIFTLNLNKC